MAKLPDVYRLLFKLNKLPLLIVVVLKMEDLVSSVECTHLSFAEPCKHVPDVRLETDDVHLVRLCRCNLTLAEKVKQGCNGVKRTGIVTEGVVMGAEFFQIPGG